MSAEPAGTSGLSPQLREFVRVSPYMRRPILRFLQSAASDLPRGSKVLDAGAGDAPYRELFGHCAYVTADFAQTDHDFVRNKPDIVCDLASIPLPDDSLDAVVCSEVLEHLPEPLKALREFRRILHDGGRLFLTVPFMWPVHEQPYDFFRYTPFALTRLLTDAGFSIDFIRPHGGRMWTMAQYVDDFGRILSARSDAPTLVRILAKILFRVVSGALASLDRFDRSRDFTLGYTVSAGATRHPAVEQAVAVE